MSQDQRTKNLQAILRWSTAQGSDGTKDSPYKAMSKEEKEWVMKALNQLTVDENEIVRRCIAAVRFPEADVPEELVEASVQKKEEAMETLVDNLGQIDLANNFLTMGGPQACFAVVKDSAL